MIKGAALLVAVLLLRVAAFAQCSICTKTAQQLGDGPASGLNSGIIYLAFIPLLVIGYIGLKWWKSEKKNNR
ncbi:hypothetical protein [Niabella aquatica]